MENSLRRLTLVVPEELDVRLDEMKKEVFYNCSRSEMIRALIVEGLNTLDNSTEKKLS